MRRKLHDSGIILFALAIITKPFIYERLRLQSSLMFAMYYYIPLFCLLILMLLYEIKGSNQIKSKSNRMLTSVWFLMSLVLRYFAFEDYIGIERLARPTHYYGDDAIAHLGIVFMFYLSLFLNHAQYGLNQDKGYKSKYISIIMQFIILFVGVILFYNNFFSHFQQPIDYALKFLFPLLFLIALWLSLQVSLRTKMSITYNRIVSAVTTIIIFVALLPFIMLLYRSPHIMTLRVLFPVEWVVVMTIILFVLIMLISKYEKKELQ